MHKDLSLPPTTIKNCFNDICSVVDARGAGDGNKECSIVIDTVKCFGFCGNQIMDRSRHTVTKY